MITIKTKEEIEVLAQGGQILANVLKEVGEYVKVGVNTEDLNSLAEKLILKYGGIPSFKGYGGENPFPATLCTSINDEIVHCIPQKNRILKDGDIVGLDVGMKWPKDGGLFTDHAITVPVGNVKKEISDLLNATKVSLEKAIDFIAPGVYVGEIGEVIEDYILSQGDYGIVSELVGHGVGYKVHEEPQIPNIRMKNKGEELRAGMVLAIEPMVNLGSPDIKVGDNGWDIKTQDSSISAHFEHTIVVTETSCRVLTKV